VTVKVNVARSPEEADLQAQGIDVMQQMFERDAAPAPEELTPELPATEETAMEEAAAVETPAETAGAEPAEEPSEASDEAPATDEAPAADEGPET